MNSNRSSRHVDRSNGCILLDAEGASGGCNDCVSDVWTAFTNRGSCVGSGCAERRYLAFGGRSVVCFFGPWQVRSCCKQCYYSASSRRLVPRPVHTVQTE